MPVFNQYAFGLKTDFETYRIAFNSSNYLLTTAAFLIGLFSAS